MKKIWFLSDPHFKHKNVITYSNRPFANVQEMDAAMIKNINDKVSVEDELYILGDFIFGSSNNAVNVLNQINCKNLFYVFGNHDDPMFEAKMVPFFKKMTPYLELKVPDEDTPRGSQLIVMCHYPILEWNKGHHGAWMLHGHCHGNLKYPPSLQNKKITDVGVDCWNYGPVSYEELKAKFKNCENIIHHGD